MRGQIRTFSEAGKPVYAECGGLMYLAESLTVNGVEHAMCGALPIAAEFPGPLELAYCEVTTNGILGTRSVARGHWFHNGRAHTTGETSPAHVVELASGKTLDEGYRRGATVASWVHLHFRSEPALADALVTAAVKRAREDSNL
jgi:cobyrinic acid a,c-diamide synthase